MHSYFDFLLQNNEELVLSQMQALKILRRLIMKQSKILLISISVLAVLVLTGCGNDQPTAAANTDSPHTSAQDNVPAPESSHAHNVTIINTSHEGTEINPSALSIEAATLVGIQYIYDVFGESVAGMYVEMEFSDWDHITRTLWHGAVTDKYRNTLENRARINELNDEFMARLDAGENSEDVFEDMSDLFGAIGYNPARFYFFIDAITGERIDIWKTTAQMLTVNESMPLHEYIDQEWDSDWDTAFAVDIDPQKEDELGQIAREYAQRQFYNSTIADVHFEGAFASFIYKGGGFNRESYATFTAINDTGREARISIHVESRTVTSINTMSNDFIPFDESIMVERGER